MSMTLTPAGLVPLLSVAFALLAFFVSYSIAVLENHVEPWLPFISDCGARQPESNIFGQLLNLSAFFFAITVYLLHSNFLAFNGRDRKGWKVFSSVVMLIGLLAALGASIVGNFQERPHDPNILPVHDTGAFMFFILSIVYVWGQLVISYSRRPRAVKIWASHIRAGISLITAGLLVFHLVCLFVEPFVNSDDNGKCLDPDEWGIVHYNGTHNSCYSNYLATTISEWCLALLLQVIVVTYFYDLSMWPRRHRTAVSVDEFEVETNVDGAQMANLSNADKAYYAHANMAFTTDSPTQFVPIEMSRAPTYFENQPHEQTNYGSGGNGGGSLPPHISTIQSRRIPRPNVNVAPTNYGQPYYGQNY